MNDSDSRSWPSQEELIALVAAQAAEIAALKARLGELERRLGLNSSNSGKPPSSDGLKKPPRAARTTSLRGPSDRPSGGQKGHKGETLEQVAAPDHTVDHVPPFFAACGAAVTLAMSTGHSARQVFDLPEPTPLVVTEHRAHDCRCATCGTHSRAGFPLGVNAPVQYGPRIAHLRELQALIDIEKEDWARRMQRLLRRACHLANLARQRGVALNTLRPRLAVRLERCYDAILAEGLAFHEAQAPLAGAPSVRPRRGHKARRTGHNLIRRLIERKTGPTILLVEIKLTSALAR
jgi:hypothetical protein